MAKKVWTFELEDGSHTVELEYGCFSGKRTIRLDGKMVKQGATKLFDTGSEHVFEIRGLRIDFLGEDSNIIQYRNSRGCENAYGYMRKIFRVNLSESKVYEEARHAVN